MGSIMTRTNQEQSIERVLNTVTASQCAKEFFREFLELKLLYVRDRFLDQAMRGFPTLTINIDLDASQKLRQLREYIRNCRNNPLFDAVLANHVSKIHAFRDIEHRINVRVSSTHFYLDIVCLEKF
jgi:hypothetical protein